MGLWLITFPPIEGVTVEMHHVSFYLLRKTRIHMLDNVVSVRSNTDVDSFIFNYKWVGANMLIVICTRELLYVGRAHPGYNQVTLERSDFRTDFRTRLKNKPFSVNDSAKLILPCQGKQAWYIQLSSVIWTVYQTIVRLVKVINVCAVRCKINLC